MRLVPVAGVLLIALGAWIIWRPPSYSREESVFRVGNIEAKMREEHTVPAWVGGAALGAGAVLLGFGLRGRSR